MAKNLKKLSFAKEELVNLNEYEMSHIKGGEAGTTTVTKITKSSKACAESATATINLTYDITKDASWWMCRPGCDCDRGGDNYRPQEIEIQESMGLESQTYNSETGYCCLPEIIIPSDKR